MANDNFVLVSGKSATGKSASLRNIKQPKGVMYLNCENNKKLPFKGQFSSFNITDPAQIYQAFLAADQNPDIHTIIIDTLTYMMDMYESIYVIPKAGTKEGMSAWGDYAQFLKVLMSNYVAKSTKNIIFLAHTSDDANDKGILETLVKVKGSLMNNGIESFFGTVVSTKKVSLKALEKFDNPNLTISEEEEIDGFKYVFQTKLTKETKDERIRSPMGMWDRNETFIDNDIQIVLDRLSEFYDD